MSHRDFIIGDRRGYVLRNRRIVIEIGGADVSMTIADAVSLSTLLDLLLRDAGARPAVWMHVLAHNLAAGHSADHDCIDCGAPMLSDDVAQGFRTCELCAAERRAAR